MDNKTSGFRVRKPSRLTDKTIRGDLYVTNREAYQGCVRKMELGKLAKDGNIYAQHQLNFDRTGLSVNFEALLTKQCLHGIETPNGHIIRLRIGTTPQIVKGFEIYEIICPLCGKTLERRIRKPKRLRRRV